MDKLRVRVYNVRFGDAILVTVPDRDGNGPSTNRHVLFDVGNSLSSSGGADDVFQPIVADILNELNGDPVDLYVSSHEHLDHVQGLFYAHHALGLDLAIRRLWLTASAEDGYYDKPGHEEAKKRNKKLTDTLSQIAAGLPMSLRNEPAIDFLLLMNGSPGPLAAADPTKTTKKCVDFLRNHDGEHSYVSRQAAIGTWEHPFDDLRIEVWAPEEDTSKYHGRFQPSALAAVGVSGDQASAGYRQMAPPAGVDAGAFFDLVHRRERGFYDNLLAIDKAKNNTSVVVSLEWHGWRLLFPGDAEQRSWKEMDKRGVLKPVHFLKVGHHGSHNATPRDKIFDAILPPVAPDGRKRCAVVSTANKPYPSVPDEEPDGSLARVRSRVDTLLDTRDLNPAGHFDISFPVDGGDPSISKS